MQKTLFGQPAGGMLTTWVQSGLMPLGIELRCGVLSDVLWTCRRKCVAQNIIARHYR